MKKLTLTFAVSLIFAFQANAQESRNKSEGKVQAERIWEQMVEAKGGHKTLDSVTNWMLTKGTAPNNQIEFYVFPNRYWEWSKGKIVYDYVRVAMANLDKGVYLSANETGITNSETFAPMSGGVNYRESWLVEACAFLLETHWLKPTPIKVTGETIDKERLDVVDTTFPDLTTLKNWGLRYYVDPESLEVRYVAHLNDNGEPYKFYYFEGQTTSFGIVVPKSFSAVLNTRKDRHPTKQALVPTKKWLVPLTFQFNVNYENGLFEAPPSVKTGPDAWKPKSK